MIYLWDLYDLPVSIEVQGKKILTALIGAKNGDPVKKELSEEFYKLWKGKPARFSIEIGSLPEHIKAILEVVRKIPFGSVSSYGDVSMRIFGDKKHSRLVGYALSINPVPVFIPCHRVVHSDGRVEGFTGDLKFKIELLRMEGVKIQNGKVPKAFFTHF